MSLQFFFFEACQGALQLRAFIAVYAHVGLRIRMTDEYESYLQWLILTADIRNPKMRRNIDCDKAGG